MNRTCLLLCAAILAAAPSLQFLDNDEAVQVIEATAPEDGDAAVDDEDDDMAAAIAQEEEELTEEEKKQRADELAKASSMGQ